MNDDASPFAYTSNNPLKYIDPNGQWKVDSNTLSKYPDLLWLLINARYLAYGTTGNQNVHQAFASLNRNFGGRPVDVSEFADFGTGPEVVVNDQGIQAGSYRYRGTAATERYKGKIFFGRQVLEKLSRAQFGSEEYKLWFSVLMRTLFHETSHWATRELQNLNEDLIEEQTGYIVEAGQFIENQIFGFYITYDATSPKEELRALRSINIVVDTEEEARALARKYKRLGYRVFIDDTEY